VQPTPRSYSCDLELPVPTRDAKLLLKLLRLRLQSRPPGAPIQKIQMTAQSSLARVTQGSLFIPTAPDPDKLELTIARITSVVGGGNVGSPQLHDLHQPDAFLMRNFSGVAVTAPVFSGRSQRFSKGGARSGFTNYSREESTPQIALHVFRPPVPARVQLQRNKPVFAAFQDRAGQDWSGKVIHASGPWRSSGHWWEEKSWQEDSWDLEISFFGDSSARHGFYRFSYDGLQEKWFVRGVYD